ncbi:50S ribosomal protein L17 [Lentisphaera araneosa HTCC2155]|jgi:large subunit ribosomal protein L17|uniref:Large ribosomal subunit protein bL17 n=1 Tax=Lentisphaera araneosa HTCC2155 TaxID=313628 RepID=A6DLN8_9BACT|nr:50S ribosomal protein L17 [Lentisphaera araneosa HTCC2155]
MRHRKKVFKIGRSTSHRKCMMANMLTSLFTHGRIKTTVVRAKELSRQASKMITLAKAGDLHQRRQAISVIRDLDAVRELFDNIAPTFKDRNGGYTRVLRMGKRRGDNAELALVELVGFEPNFEEAEEAEEVVAEDAAPAEETSEDTKEA